MLSFNIFSIIIQNLNKICTHVDSRQISFWILFLRQLQIIFFVHHMWENKSHLGSHCRYTMFSDNSCFPSHHTQCVLICDSTEEKSLVYKIQMLHWICFVFCFFGGPSCTVEYPRARFWTPNCVLVDAWMAEHKNIVVCFGWEAL